LAQWSLHRAFETGRLDPIDFAAIAKKEYQIEAVEYVNSFYKDKGSNESFWQMMKMRSDEIGVKNLLIMVDDEGDLGDADDQNRQTAVANHYKWIHAAKTMECHSIRVNAFGADNSTIFKNALTNGLTKLSTYAAQENINILIENHGLFSSNAPLIVEIIKAINLPNLGTLPDFGNWCLSAKWGSTQDGSCLESYDLYKGVEEFLPYAKGVSAKSYNFDKNGLHRNFDFQKMLTLVKNAHYDGHIGIEYEGTVLGEPEGIRATKAHLEQVWSHL
jgi:L-ribulose-5-phosphate 3-epimerase